MVSKRLLLIGIAVALVLGAGVSYAQSYFFNPYTGNYTLPATNLKYAMENVLNDLVHGGGLMMAAAHVDGIPAAPVVNRYTTKLPGNQPVTVLRLGVGTYEVRFGANVSGRYYAAVQGEAVFGVPAGGYCEVTPRVANPSALFIQTFDNAGVSIDTAFYVEVW